MSTCKIKASAAFIMYLIWTDIYSHLKKRVFVNLDWHYSNLWKERYHVLVNMNWNLQEFHNLVGQTWTSCAPASHICFPSLHRFQWAQSCSQTHQDIYKSIPVALCKQCDSKKLFYMGNTQGALGSRATPHKLVTAVFTHKSASDPPAPSGSSVVAHEILLQWGVVTTPMTISHPLPLLLDPSQRRNTSVLASPHIYGKWKGRAILAWSQTQFYYYVF